jgi:hypothetical protein
MRAVLVGYRAIANAGRERVRALSPKQAARKAGRAKIIRAKRAKNIRAKGVGRRKE